MRAILGFGLAAVMAVGVATAADVDPAKLVGKWQGERKGSKVTMDFSKDGKVTFTGEAKGTEIKFEGTYKLDNDKLTVKMNFAGKEIERKSTIKKLTGEELTIEDEKGKTDTLKRVK